MTIYVNVYEVGQEFGGPEEGGWYFETGVPVTSLKVEDTDGLTADDFWGEVSACEAPRELTEDERRTVKMISETIVGPLQYSHKSNHRYSVRPQGTDYRVRVEDAPGVAYPEEAPHYE